MMTWFRLRGSAGNSSRTVIAWSFLPSSRDFRASATSEVRSAYPKIKYSSSGDSRRNDCHLLSSLKSKLYYSTGEHRTRNMRGSDGRSRRNFSHGISEYPTQLSQSIR